MRASTAAPSLRIVTALLLAAVLTSAGCVFRHGPQMQEMTTPFAAGGAFVELILQAGRLPERVSGELLEVGDTAVLVLSDHVWLVPNRAIVLMRPVEKSIGIRPAHHMSEARATADMRLFARFPYGMPTGTLARILANLRQIAPRVPTAFGSGMHPETMSGHEPPLQERTDAFLRDARDATARYRSRTAAIADGYRRIGPSFPGMGQHWVHPGLIVSRTLDPRRPPVLCYADSAGTATLVGLAFAVPLEAGEAPPEIPMGSSVWHHHDDAIDAETLLLVHRAPGEAATPHLAMFHVWTWLENPDGMFAQNNWAIPFAQLGLSVRAPTAEAAQALALLTAGDTYYLQIFDRIIDAEPSQREIMRAGLNTAMSQVHDWRTALTTTTVHANDVHALEGIWSGLWQSVDDRVDARTREQLRGWPGRAGPERDALAPHPR